MAIKKVKMRLIDEYSTKPQKQNGNWYDCTTRKMEIVRGDKLTHTLGKTEGVMPISKGDIVVMYLGFACDMGEGYEAQVKPRSSTFKKYGLLQGNAVGLIDDSYNGNNDEWMVYWYATRNTILPVNGRFCQMTIEKSNPKVNIELVEDLGNEDRGGFGTTGE